MPQNPWAMRATMAALAVVTITTILFRGSCSGPSASDQLAPLMGKTGHVLVIADVDASGSSAQWMRDVRLQKLVTIDGKEFVAVRFVGLEASPANDGKPIVVSLLVSHIVQVEMDGELVYVREE